MTIRRLAAVAASLFFLAGCGAETAAPVATLGPSGSTVLSAPLTLATYAKLQDGMTLAKVQTILGGVGVAISTLPDSSQGAEDGVWMWGSPAQAATMGEVLVTFQSGRLATRSEVGLS